MVSGSLALLYFPSFHGGKQGSGPNRKLSLVEWGDFPYVRLSVRTSVRMTSVHPSVFFSLKVIFKSFFGYFGGPLRPPICAQCIHMDLDP